MTSIFTTSSHPAYSTNARLDRSDRSFLDDPPPEDLWCPLISVDDHVLEPADTFSRRLPARLARLAPRQVTDEDGALWWEMGDRREPVILGNGVVGRPMTQWATMVPARLDDFRPAVWDPKARLRDMDLCGVWASLCFPSITWGFAGWHFGTFLPSDVGLACVKAYNDWMVEEWCAADPDRYIPCQLPWFGDAQEAAAEIRRNAARGFKCVSFSEDPEALGHPSVYDEYWDPFFAACEETETVINLHVGSSGRIDTGTSRSPRDVKFALFPVSGLRALIDWVFSRVAVRYPGLRIALSEAGVSWVPMALERLARAYRQRDVTGTWQAGDPSPVEVAQRNFYFTSIEDPSAFRLLDLVGEDRVMFEIDYPHPDSTWPRSQAVVREQTEALDLHVVRAVCYKNAARVYRHPEPPTPMIERAAVGTNGR